MIKKFNFKKYQNKKNGLFPASIKSKNNLMKKIFWIRDNYYIYLAVEDDLKKKMIRGFQKIIDNNIKKIKLHSKEKPTKDYMHIHPRYNEDLKEIQEPWGWVQNDAIGNLLEVLSNIKDKDRAELLVSYLNTIEFWKCPDFGFWEEGPKQIRSSSLASCIRGLESFQTNISNNKKLEKIIDLGYKTIYEIIPKETKKREHDLALLSLIYPKQIISTAIKNRIITNVQCLEGHWGVKRYFKDSWNGNEKNQTEKNRMQWVIGLPWLYLCTQKIDYLLRAIELKKEFYSCLPEGIINGEPNKTDLIWSEAMYKLAVDKYEKENQKPLNQQV